MMVLMAIFLWSQIPYNRNTMYTVEVVSQRVRCGARWANVLFAIIDQMMLAILVTAMKFLHLTKIV